MGKCIWDAPPAERIIDSDQYFLYNYFTMRIITRKRLLEFAAKHPSAHSGLDHWYRVMKRNDFTTFAELRQTFPHADQVGKLTIFNIGGNKARLIAAIHYNHRRVYIRHVLTHTEYDQGKWKEE